MNIQKSPNTLEKLDLMGDSTQFEPAGDQPAGEARPRRAPSCNQCFYTHRRKAYHDNHRLRT